MSRSLCAEHKQCNRIQDQGNGRKQAQTTENCETVEDMVLLVKEDKGQTLSPPQKILGENVNSVLTGKEEVSNLQ